MKKGICSTFSIELTGMPVGDSAGVLLGLFFYKQDAPNGALKYICILRILRIDNTVRITDL